LTGLFFVLFGGASFRTMSDGGALNPHASAWAPNPNAASWSPQAPTTTVNTEGTGTAAEGLAGGVAEMALQGDGSGAAEDERFFDDLADSEWVPAAPTVSVSQQGIYATQVRRIRTSMLLVTSNLAWLSL
jgi:hypothetical protein